MRGSVPPTMRIGELAAKVGVSTHVLRAWESRYGLLRPVRSAGGYRLYGHEDERRVREVIALRDQGVSAAEATERGGASGYDDDSDDGSGRPGAADGALGTNGSGPASGVGTPNGSAPPGLRADPPMLVAQLLDAVTALDEDRAHAVLDTAFHERSVESAIIDVLLPLVVRVGEMWELSYGVLLGRAGWRIRYLGPDTPIHSLSQAARLTQADAVVLACRRPTGFRGHASALRRLSEDHPVWLAGRGATPRVLEEVGVPNLGVDLIAAVAELTATARARRATRSRSEAGKVAQPSAARGGPQPTA